MIIRVDPAVLKQCSGNISGVGNNINLTGQGVVGLSRSAPSYNGQFGPRVQAIGMEALTRSQGLSAQMNDHSTKLQVRAQAFEAADMGGVSAFIFSDPAFSNPNNLLVFGRFPDSSIEKYMCLGAASSAPSKFWTGGLVLDKWWEKWEAEKTLGFIGKSKKLPIFGETRGRPYKNEKGEKLKLNFPVWEGRACSTGEDPVRLGGVPINFAAGALAVGLGTGFDSKGRLYGGLNIEGTLAEANTSGTLLGDKNLGLGGSAGIQVGHADAFAGYKDGTVGAEIGVDLVRAEGTLGGNFAGKNVGVTGSIGIGFKLGFKIGKDTKIALGPFEIGFHIGEAL